MGKPEFRTEGPDTPTNAEAEGQVEETREELRQSGRNFKCNVVEIFASSPSGAVEEPVTSSWFLCKPGEVDAALERLGWDGLPNINHLLPKRYRNADKVYVLDSGSDGPAERQVEVLVPGDGNWACYITISPGDHLGPVSGTVTGDRTRRGGYNPRRVWAG